MTRTARRIATIAALAATTLAPAAPAAAFEASWERFHLSDAPERTHLKVKMTDLIVSSLQGTTAGRVLETQALAFKVETDARGNVVAGNFIGTDALSAADEDDAAALLLPAIQKVREQANRARSAQAPLFVISRVETNVDLDGDRISDATVAAAPAGAEGYNAIAVDSDALPDGGERAAFSYGR